jgi:hypothetical protein
MDTTRYKSWVLLHLTLGVSRSRFTVSNIEYQFSATVLVGSVACDWVAKRNCKVYTYIEYQVHFT